MNEQLKTAVYISLAAVFLVIAWFARPASPGREAFDDSGDPFFAEFVDP